MAGFHSFKPTAKTPLRTELPREQPNPILLLLPRLIGSAFLDCLETRSGRPTEQAMLAYEWLLADTDYSRPGRQIPESQDLRDGHLLSFQHCCAWLNLDPVSVLEHGLPKQTCRKDPRAWHNRPQRTRPVQTGASHTRKHVAGLGEVRQVWARAAAAWAERQAQDPDLYSVAPPGGYRDGCHRRCVRTPQGGMTGGQCV